MWGCGETAVGGRPGGLWQGRARMYGEQGVCSQRMWAFNTAGGGLLHRSALGCVPAQCRTSEAWRWGGRPLLRPVQQGAHVRAPKCRRAASCGVISGGASGASRCILRACRRLIVLAWGGHPDRVDRRWAEAASPNDRARGTKFQDLSCMEVPWRRAAAGVATHMHSGTKCK